MNYSPEQIAEMHDYNENFNGTRANFSKMQLYQDIRNDLEKFMESCKDVQLVNGFTPNIREKHAMLWMDFYPAAILNKEDIALLVSAMQKADGVVFAAVDNHIRISFDVKNVWEE